MPVKKSEPLNVPVANSKKVEAPKKKKGLFD
jgi:hypothetical protein